MSNLNNRKEKIGYLISNLISIDNHLNKSIAFDTINYLINENNDYDLKIYEENSEHLSQDTIIKKLTEINEKTNNRKKNGAYYTPIKLTNYIILNSILNSLDLEEKLHNELDAYKLIGRYDIKVLNNLLFKSTFFDPTCGSGEFLINVLDIKLRLQFENFEVTDSSIVKIAKTVYGNDLNIESLRITKLRIFLLLARKIKNPENYFKIMDVINHNFSNKDFVNLDGFREIKFDYIVGNPPYIEYKDYSDSILLKNKYGNIYANVIDNALNYLKKDGFMTFILPLSFISTARMKSIRKLISSIFSKQIIINFADRPASLFPGVHQKISILFAKKSNKSKEIYVSSYLYMKKNENLNILNKIEIYKSGKSLTNYIPKIGNQIENSIYNKVTSCQGKNLIEFQDFSGDKIFLNMRATFWIKAFSFNPGSKEYKILYFSNPKNYFVLSVLNSSLFWMYWAIVSDGWHINKSLLLEFIVPDVEIDYNVFKKLYFKLENQLESTKILVNTKQTNHEYKHKLCKSEIDDIDLALSKVYKITTSELEYIKNFAIKYRIGDSK